MVKHNHMVQRIGESTVNRALPDDHCLWFACGQLPAGIQGFQVASCSVAHFSAALSAVMPWLVM
jgi:hypothetical protein